MSLWTLIHYMATDGIDYYAVGGQKRPETPLPLDGAALKTPIEIPRLATYYLSCRAIGMPPAYLSGTALLDSNILSYTLYWANRLLV